MKKIVLLLVAALLLAGCTSKPVLNIENENVPTDVRGGQYTVQQVEAAILSATRKRGWSPRIIKPGLIEASISVRSHRATIEIPYSSSQYSIHYKDSQNLNYDDGSIHRNYNNWVVKLGRTIQDELGVNSQKY